MISSTCRSCPAPVFDPNLVCVPGKMRERMMTCLKSPSSVSCSGPTGSSTETRQVRAWADADAVGRPVGRVREAGPFQDASGR